MSVAPNPQTFAQIHQGQGQGQGQMMIINAAGQQPPANVQYAPVYQQQPMFMMSQGAGQVPVQANHPMIMVQQPVVPQAQPQPVPNAQNTTPAPIHAQVQPTMILPNGTDPNNPAMVKTLLAPTATPPPPPQQSPTPPVASTTPTPAPAAVEVTTTQPAAATSTPSPQPAAQSQPPVNAPASMDTS